MAITELLHHPLLEHVAQDRETYHKNYIMSGLQELQSIIYKDAAVSNSSAYFTIKPPYGSIIDRNILVELTVTVTTPAGANNYFGDYFCPKSMPANRLIDTCNLKINSTAIMSEPGRYVSALSQYKTNQEFIKKYRSLSPTEPDHTNRYSNLAVGTVMGSIAAVGGAWALPGNINATNFGDCPLSPFGNTSRSTEDYECRGAFPFTTSYVAAGGAFTTTRTYTFCEPLLNPFVMVREDTACAHVTDLTCQLNFTPNMDRAFSGLYEMAYLPVATNNLTTCNSFNTLGAQHADARQGGFAPTYAITGARLLVKIGTPSIPLSIKQDIGYNEIQVNTQMIGQHTAANPIFGADGRLTQSVTFNALRLSCIPSHFIIFARPAVTGQTRFQADAFLAINNISITINNKTGILSNMDQKQLYNISAENGVNMSWAQWSRRVGSVLCLCSGKDLVQILPSVREVMDFTFTINMQNTTLFDHSQSCYGSMQVDAAGATLVPTYLDQIDQSITWELVVMSIFGATLTVEDNFSAKTIGISPDEAMDAIKEGPSVETLRDVNQAIGGGFGEWLGKTLHKGWHVVKKFARPVASLVSQIAGDVPIIGPLAKGINAVANFTDAHEMAQQQRLQQQQPQLMETRHESSGSGRHRYRGGGMLLN